MTNLNNKTILFIEPYGSTLSLLNHGLSAGCSVIILTANKGLRVVSEKIKERVNRCVYVDTADNDACIEVVDELAKKLQIHAVIPGFEYFVPLAVCLSRRLGLVSNMIDDVAPLRNKALMRTKLMKAGIKMPAFKIITSISDLNEAMKVVSFPAICKPVDAAGSVNVKKVKNKGEAFLAASRILHVQDELWGYRLTNALVYESYVSGKEYSLEGVVISGKIYHLNMTEKILADELDFVEVGHLVNAPMSPDLKNKLRHYIDSVIKVLAPDNCPFHAELRLDNEGEPVLMEIAARLAGDKIGDLINLTSSFNYFDAVYAAYFGQPIEVNEEQHNYAGIRFFYRPRLNKYSTVTHLFELNQAAEEVCFYYQSNQSIPSFPKALRRLGHVVIKSNDYHALKQQLREVDESVIFHE